MEFKQKLKIRMIDISCRFYLQNNDVTYTYCINFVEAIIRHQCRELPAVALSYHLNKKLLTSWVVFAVNRCFMENKNMLRIFCSCKPSKKNNTESQQNFIGSYKKYEGSGLTPKYAEHQKVKR